MKSYQITIHSAAGTNSYIGIFASNFDATIDAMDRAPVGARISVKPTTATA